MADAFCLGGSRRMSQMLQRHVPELSSVRSKCTLPSPAKKATPKASSDLFTKDGLDLIMVPLGCEPLLENAVK